LAILKKPNLKLWERHILDSAQLVRYIDFSKGGVLADLGTGAGFPGLLLAIYNQNPNFHVKLYDKSLVKCKFLNSVIKKNNINAEVISEPLNNCQINADYVVNRAFKKLPDLLKISREIIRKPYKLIVLKGKNAQEEIDKAFMKVNYSYKLVNSITDKDSKIIIMDVK